MPEMMSFGQLADRIRPIVASNKEAGHAIFTVFRLVRARTSAQAVDPAVRPTRRVSYAVTNFIRAPFCRRKVVYTNLAFVHLRLLMCLGIAKMVHAAVGRYDCALNDSVSGKCSQTPCMMRCRIICRALAKADLRSGSV